MPRARKSDAERMTRMTLGQRIRQARIDRGMTQKQLVGDHITRNMLSKIENDSATPSVRTLEYIASRLSLPAGYFMAGASYSDGTSPDGLDDMRAAYRRGDYAGCIRLLEENPHAATSDEGYLLHARAALAAARQALDAGRIAEAKEYADTADYYNRQSMYDSAETDAEMSLILAECALELDPAEFEENAKEYERAVRGITFTVRYGLARADYLLKTGETELAGQLLQTLHPETDREKARHLFLSGEYCRAAGRQQAAIEMYSAAEQAGDALLLPRIYRRLEDCYREQDNYKMAYIYAARQLR